MATTPRPWYRSPALWFFLPGLVFILWAWVFSMQRETSLDLQTGGFSLNLQNDGSAASTSWEKTPSPHLLTFPPAKAFDFTVRPRWQWASKEWFPLPFYMRVPASSSTHRHDFVVPHWFLLLVYTGLWQLPWLARYHRRRRIDRLSLAAAD